MLQVCLLLFLLTLPLVSQVRVEAFSEFQRVDVNGEILASDRAEWPREILSPMAPLNSHLTIRLVVHAPPGEFFHIRIAQNPEGRSSYAVYREVWEQAGDVWVADRLEPVSLPHTGMVPYASPAGPPLKALSFLLDIYIPENTKPDRFRVEAQISQKDAWTIVPFEIRPFSFRVPRFASPVKQAPPVTAPADASAVAVLRAGLCPETAPPDGGSLLPGGASVRSLIIRNAAQDLAIAKALEGKLGKGFFLGQVAAAAGFPNPQKFCTEAVVRGENGAEWYLKARDFLLRAAQPSDETP